MGIYEGSGGSILCFVNYKIIASVPITKKKTVHYYKDLAESILIDALREGKWTLKNAGNHSLAMMKDRRYFNRKYLTFEENEYIILIGFILHKLKIWDYEMFSHGLFITDKKRPRRKY
jgi:hypothetical protein